MVMVTPQGMASPSFRVKRKPYSSGAKVSAVFTSLVVLRMVEPSTVRV